MCEEDHLAYFFFLTKVPFFTSIFDPVALTIKRLFLIKKQCLLQFRTESGNLLDLNVYLFK